MFPHHRFVGSNIDAVNFILRDMTLEPLNLRPRFASALQDFSEIARISAVAVLRRKILCRRQEIANVYSLRDKPD
jgi:hypothetical protein